MYSNDLICQILDYIDQNLDSEITIEEISQNFFFNRFYIMKKFKTEIGLTIISYIKIMRIIASITDFQKDRSITAIGLRHGFQSLEYFSETFTQIMHVSPSCYRNFVLYRQNISELEMNTIRERMIEIQKIKLFALRYRERRKPLHNPVKKLTIFK